MKIGTPTCLHWGAGSRGQIPGGDLGVLMKFAVPSQHLQNPELAILHHSLERAGVT